MHFKRLEYGTDPETFRRDWMLYVSIQVLIFIKVILFFLWFGHGISYRGQPLALDIPFMAMPVFGNLFHVWEYFFHQFMHILIAFWVALYAKHLIRFEWKSVAKLFFIATVLHNVGYWFTASHPSWLFSLRDFVTDYVTLWGFFTLFWFFLNGFPRLKKWATPFFG